MFQITQNFGLDQIRYVSVFVGLLSLQFNKHLFVHIGQSNPSYSDPYLESVDIRQIYDKFPEKKGGLKELFDKGPHNAFFLVKFWVKHCPLFYIFILPSCNDLMLVESIFIHF